MSTELKCPHCGAVAKVVKTTPSNRYRVVCPRHRCGSVGNPHPTREEAVNDWRSGTPRSTSPATQDASERAVRVGNVLRIVNDIKAHIPRRDEVGWVLDHYDARGHYVGGSSFTPEQFLDHVKGQIHLLEQAALRIP